MLTRIITAVLGIPLVIIVLLLGGTWLKVAMLVVSGIALYEMYHVMRENYKPIKWLGYSVIGMYYLFLSGYKITFLFL